MGNAIIDSTHLNAAIDTFCDNPQQKNQENYKKSRRAIRKCETGESRFIWQVEFWYTGRK